MNLKLGIKLLEGTGARLPVPPEPGEAFNGHDITFLMTKNGLNGELIDTEEKHGLAAANEENPV